MKQAFDVWFANKDSILFDVSVGVHHGENYKLARPNQLYHLDMYQVNEKKHEQEQSQIGSMDPVVNLDSQSFPASSHEDVVSNTMQDFQSLSVGNMTSASEKPLLKPPNLPQPGAFHGAPVEGMGQLVQPENIQWIYLDASGNEQGPFTGDVMQEWLGDGYLSLDLQIRRQEQSSFQTLRLFCESINNYILPFKTPLPPVGAENPLGGSSHLPVAPLLSRNASAFGAHVPSVVPDSVSAQATGVSMTSSGLFGAAQQASQGSQQQQQSSFNSNLYPQMMPNNGFGAGGLRALSLNIMFDYNASKDYSLMNPPFSAGSQFGLDALNQNIGGGFGQLHMPSLLHQQIHGQQPVLARAKSGWAVDSPIPNQMPQAPVAGAPGPLNIALTGLGGPSLTQPSPMSPWINRVSSSRAASPFIPTASLSNEDTVLNDLHSSMVTGILNDEEPSMGYFQQRNSMLPSESVSSKKESKTSVSQEASSGAANPTSVLSNLGFDSESSAIKQAHANARATQASASKPVVTEEPSPVAPKTSGKSAVELALAQAESSLQNEPEQAPEPVKVVETPVAAAPTSTSLAPWAKKAPEVETPALSLKEVQKMEAEWLEKEKQSKAELQRELALAEAIAASKQEEKSAASVERVPSFNWASSSQDAVAKKTLAEIQKEEEEAARTRAMKKTALGTVPMKSSLASTLASAVPKDDMGGAWTAVTKKPVVKKALSQNVTPVVSYSMMSGAINPQALRTASSNDVPLVSINAMGLKEDFLVWARSSMTNLYPSVSKDDLLEVFTTLPLHGDSQQLISETIYSSSATMDGRRFAQEFMKKRQQVERQIGANAVGSWSSAIASSADKTPAVDDDGWSTSVKSKKKGRKN